MKKYIFTVYGCIAALLCFGQYTNLNASLDNTRFCNTASTIRIYGTVTAGSNISNGYHFVGMIFRFYTLIGTPSLIGTYTVNNISGSLVTSYSNINALYYDGSPISGAQVITNTYNSGSPLNGGIFTASIQLPYNSFFNQAGRQFYVAVEGIDQSSSTTTVSSFTPFSNPILYANGPLNKPGISANKTYLCSGDQSTITTSPDLTAQSTYTWYKDGAIVPGQTAASLTTGNAGSYYAYINDGCQNTTTDAIQINAGQIPAPPVISSSNGTQLCDGASTILSTNPSYGGTIHWSTSYAGNSISVSALGNYYAIESNACGNSSNSNTISINTLSTPVATVVSPSGPVLVCNGNSTTISSSGSVPANVIWYFNGSPTGHFGASYTVSAAGMYATAEQNSCGTGQASNAVTVSTMNAPPAPTVNPPTSQLLCNGASATLTSSGSNISWSNGVTGNRLVTSTAGNYYAIDQNTCGNSAPSNTVVITTGNCPIPAPGSSFYICPGTQKLLDAGAGYDSYLWSDGETTQKVNVGPGTYSVTVMKNGCSAVSAIVTVSNYSVGGAYINASGPTNFCSGNSVTLSASVGSAFLWSNGSTANSIVVNSAGSFSVTITDANGCQAGSAPITTTVNAVATATISGSSMVCQNGGTPVISFSASGGVAPYVFTYSLNGGANQTISTNSGNTVGISVPSTMAGSFVYSLVGVQESSGTACSSLASGTATVVVNPLPTAAITGTNTLCQNASQPAIVFTGSGGTAPYTFQYSINGGVTQSISTLTGNSISVAVPTNTSGSFDYQLLSVKESSPTYCSNTASGDATVMIHPLPTATISGTTTICQNGAQPQIVFTGNTGTSPYSFSYSINGGPTQTISTTTGNAVGIPAPTNNSGVFVYTLISVQESSSTACLNTANGTATITINPQPAKATLAAPVTHLCNGVLGQITVLNYTNGFQYTWYKAGSQYKVSFLDTVMVSQAGNYQVNISSDLGCDAPALSDPVNISIGNVSTPIITGFLKVCPQGKTKLSVLPTDTTLVYEVWKWSDPPGNILNQGSIFSASAGQYQVNVGREGCFDSTSIAITSDDTEFPAGQLQVNPKQISYGGSVTLIASVTGAANYQWDLGDGNIRNDLGDTVVQNYYRSSDSIPIRLWAISERNCITPFSASIQVGGQAIDTMVNESFTGNLKDWNLYPVPFHDRLAVSVVLKKPQTIRMDLFAADGRWIRSWTFNGITGENLFYPDGLSILPTGVVFFIVAYYNGLKHYDKIFKN